MRLWKPVNTKNCASGPFLKLVGDNVHSPMFSALQKGGFNFVREDALPLFPSNGAMRTKKVHELHESEPTQLKLFKEHCFVLQNSFLTRNFV